MRDVMSSTGKYIKSVCVLDPGFDHPGSYKACESTGMKLYVIDSTDTQNEIFRIVKLLFGTGGWHIIWVDGIKDATGWFYYSYGKKAAWTGLKWQTSAAKAKGCVAVTDYFGPYNIDGFPCDGGCTYACELQK